MEVSKQIIEVLDYLCKKIGVVVDWSQGNVMPYVQDLYRRFIAWQIAIDVFQLILATMLASVSAGVIKWRYKNCIKYNGWEDEDYVIVAVLSGTFVGAVVWWACTVPGLIEVITVPEKILFDYVSSQMR